MRVGTMTPWGRADKVRKIADGIWECETPGHGGYRVDPHQNAAIHPALRKPSGWYEEDCDWARVVMNWPALFADEIVQQADQTLRDWYPDAYGRFTGHPVTPEESHVLRDRDFDERHRNDWVVVCAWGDWLDGVPKGYVKVLARLGGRSPHGRGPDRAFLVPESEYNAWRFVVDPAIHQEVTL